MSNLRQIGLACHTHAAEHNDRAPESFEALVEGGFLTHGVLVSPVGSVWDDGGDYWLNTSVEMMSDVPEPWRFILAYDRTSYANMSDVLVLFYDGHVEKVDHWRFSEMVDSPLYEGVDFNLP